MLPNKFQIPGLKFTENGTEEIRLPKGQLLIGVVLSLAYTDTISVAATAARARGAPIKRITLLDDTGKVLHSVKPQDLVREMEIYEQQSLASLAAPPTGLTVAAHTGTADLPLMFAEAFAADGMLTALPTWIYDELILRVEWGGHAELYVGGTGVVTVQSLAVTGLSVEEDFSPLGDPYTWARFLAKNLRSYKEVAAPAVANQEFPIELPRTADHRALIVVTEDANGQPVDTILNAITLEIDNARRQFNRVPYRMLRGDNAKLFGVAMPPGVVILEFADDKDIAQILESTKMTALNLILDTTAVPGTIRVFQKRIEPGAAAA